MSLANTIHIVKILHDRRKRQDKPPAFFLMRGTDINLMNQGKILSVSRSELRRIGTPTR